MLDLLYIGINLNPSKSILPIELNSFRIDIVLLLLNMLDLLYIGITLDPSKSILPIELNSFRIDIVLLLPNFPI